MLLFCPSWLSSLLAYVAPVIFVLRLPFKQCLGLFAMEFAFQYKKLINNFEIFLSEIVTV